MANLTMVRFVDDGFLYKQSGYLHAKALYIDADEQQQVLITGSANPSAPAWLAHTGARNAEAMIFRSGPEASHIADRLGLKTLGEQPQLSSERWKHLSISSFAIPRPADGPIHSFAIAVETADGFLLPMLDLHLEYLQAIHLLNENAVRLPFPSKVGQDTTGLTQGHSVFKYNTDESQGLRRLGRQPTASRRNVGMARPSQQPNGGIA
jgi:hypothetical protein